MNPISKYLLAISILIILLAGVVPSIIKDNWLWLSRSGSLLTAYAIAITFLDLTGFINNDAEGTSARIDEILASCLSDVSLEKINQIEQEKKKILNGMTLSFRRVEFWSLILGTLIWGYGDLLNYL